MARIESFLMISENPVDMGLCDHCADTPSSSHPVYGCVFCEGRYCPDAYMNYVNSILEEDEESCYTCKHNAYCKMSEQKNECDDCDGYDHYEPVDNEEE